MIDQLQLLRDCLVVTIYLYQIIYYTLHVQYFDAMRCHYLSPLNHFTERSGTRSQTPRVGSIIQKYSFQTPPPSRIHSMRALNKFHVFDVDDCSTALAVSLPGIMIININISNINALHCDCVESTNTHLGSAKSVFLNSCFPFPELADKQLETNSLPHTISWETKINHMAAMAFAPEIFYHYLSTCRD